MTEQPKPFSCDKCGIRFTLNKARLAHDRKFHDNNLVTFDCPVCAKTFSTKYTLKVHMNDVHNETKTFDEIEAMCASVKRNTRRVQRIIVKKKKNSIHRDELACGFTLDSGQICGIIAHGKWNMKRHMQTHVNMTEQRPRALAAENKEVSGNFHRFLWISSLILIKF